MPEQDQEQNEQNQPDQNQTPQDNSHENSPPDTQQSSPPPTNQNQQDPATNQMITLYEAALRDQHAELERLRKEKQELEQQRNTPSSGDGDNDYFRNPRQAIREEVARAVQPLNDFVSQLRTQDSYTLMKRKIASNAQQFPQFGELESLIDQMLINSSDKSEQAIVTAYYAALGIKTAGAYNQSTPPTPSAQPPQPPAMRPPHVQPSAPPMPRGPSAPKRRELNEAEKRIARERGLTEDQYFEWLELPPTQVVSAAIGQPPRQQS